MCRMYRMCKMTKCDSEQQIPLFTTELFFTWADYFSGQPLTSYIEACQQPKNNTISYRSMLLGGHKYYK